MVIRKHIIIGNAYDFGRGLKRDEKKAAHYYELAAMGGDVEARTRGASEHMQVIGKGH